MIFDAVVRAHAVLNTNFAADLVALISAKGVAGAVSATTVLLRRGSDSFAEDATPATARLGVYWSGDAQTQARRQDERHSTVWVEAEYYARGSDPDVLSQQTELAAEAVVHSIDRMNEGLQGSRILDAGGPEGSVSIRGPRLANIKAGEKSYEDQVIVRFPVMDEDIGLA